MRRYSAREVAKQLGLHPRTIRREVARGNLGAIRSPSGYFMNVPADALDYWLTNGNAGKVLAHSLRWSSRRRNAGVQPPHDTDVLVTKGGDKTHHDK